MSSRRPSNTILIVVGIVLISAFVGFGVKNDTNTQPFSFGKDSKKSSPAGGCIDDVYNSTLGFENIFVIGLPSRTDRRDSLVLASALSNIKLEFTDGVLGETVPDKALPIGKAGQERPANPVIGSWRGHMNAIQEVVRRNLSSALIMEDDADWDVRLRKQLRAFALSSQALTQPLQGTKSVYMDTSYPRSQNKQAVATELHLDSLPHTINPIISPYGDEWDVLWLGHCGMHFASDKLDTPSGLVVHENDETVPQKQHLWTLSNPNDVKELYPEHTRVVHHVEDGVCSLVYAVSQKGARQLLYEAGLKNFDAAFDIILRWFCEGTGGRRPHTCLTSSPGLFQHHRPKGPKSGNSDISDHGDGFQDKAYSDVVRWSVRLNAEAIMTGEPLVDQYPDA
ncbi:hypothetical protein TruAng_009706 [Truncatella angustata]|nr:hypothetical protein TruAng_009706 [Truncatella angustata]